VTRAHYRVDIPPEVAQHIGGLHPQLKRQVRAALSIIVADPWAGKPLIRELAGLSSFRVGRVRIVYRVTTGRVVELVAVGPREAIYDLTERLIGKNEDSVK